MRPLRWWQKSIVAERVCASREDADTNYAVGVVAHRRGDGGDAAAVAAPTRRTRRDVELLSE